MDLSFVGTAQAMAPGQGQGASPMAGIFPILGIFVIFYFLLIRPQQKMQREKKLMLEHLKKGDRVITMGGLYGTVEKIKDQVVLLEIAERVRVEVAKSAIQGVSAPPAQQEK